MCSFLLELQTKPTEALKVPVAAAGVAGHRAEPSAACQGVPVALPVSSMLNEPGPLGTKGQSAPSFMHAHVRTKMFYHCSIE